METSILVTTPGNLTAADKKLLRDAGVVVIEAERPEDVRFIRPGTELSHGDMLYAAMRGVEQSDYSKKEFAIAMAAMVKANHKDT